MISVVAVAEKCPSSLLSNTYAVFALFAPMASLVAVSETELPNPDPAVSTSITVAGMVEKWPSSPFSKTYVATRPPMARWVAVSETARPRRA